MPHTMARMGDVLAGFHAAWEFESDSVLIRFERGIRSPKLFQALGERRIPLEAIAAVTLTPGKRGTVVLRAVPRPGADPLVEAAAGQLKEGATPIAWCCPPSARPSPSTTRTSCAGSSPRTTNRPSAIW